MEIMTEWKKFVPYILRLSKYNFQLKNIDDRVESDLAGINYDIVVDVDLRTDNREFEVTYPKTAYPIFY
jgi:hypothetical protein